MKTLEEVTYEAGRDALADQESLVAGVRQRTGTLLAAQALVASFRSPEETLGWLAGAGFAYQALRVENAKRVTWIARLSGALGVLMILQTVLGLVALGVS